MIRDLPPKHCFDLREADPSLLHLDVRSPAEFAGGRPRGSINVPFLLRGPGGFVPNPEFEARAKEALGEALDQRVILSCAAGGRSRRAAELLEGLGYENLINMSGGFSGARGPDGTLQVPGWSSAGLPTDAD